MTFSFYSDDTDIFPVFRLRNNETQTEAVVYSFGGLLNAFIVNGQNVVDGFSSCRDAKENITNGFKSCKLSPFVCRLPQGKYMFNDREYTTGKFFLGKEAIHGLIYDCLFEVTDSGADEKSAFVSMQYKYTKKDEGFPFSYECAITYKLQDGNRLSVVTEVTNMSNDKMPLSDGWHPYFTLGNSVNDLQVQINTNKLLEFDDRLVPTGKILSYNKFQQPELFGDTFLDNCFILSDHNNPACILKNKTLQLSILPDASYPYLQIYAPPHRKSIAIENLSSAPNAFNNKIGLIVLQPGERKKFYTSFQVQSIE
ncbi:MAG TPA: aldose 1-epimerase [Parafilimonas sp.]|nr:aldose 1-epimerase [Parafilimonas sp.]